MKSLPFLLASALLIVSGCQSSSTVQTASTSAANASEEKEGAESFLKKSMDVYGAMPSFAAEGSFEMNSAGMAMPASKRSFSYQKPNLFKVVSMNFAGFAQTSVSDGKTLIEYDNQTGFSPRKQSAPEKISDATSMQMKHPMFCGTLLYQFFGGSANYEHLVDTKKDAVTFGATETAEGEPAQVVKFYGPDQYGHVEALIGKQSGFVYRIQYDSEPLLKSMQDPAMIKGIQEAARSASKGSKESEAMTQALSSMSKPTAFMSIEKYSKLKVGASIPATAFDTTPPKGTVASEIPAMPSFNSAPPIPLGSEAPDFTVTKLDGNPVKLSSLRGHPVLLDFWATWCGPCVAALPHTQEIYTKARAAGLEVLAISDENKEKVAGFIKEKGYTFPTALDTTKAAGIAYKTEAIPTTVIIDASGKLVAYIVGGGRDKEIADALGKVGIKLSE